MKFIYNYYSINGEFLGERTYIAKDKEDYDRVWEIIERNPHLYELVNCEYDFKQEQD